MIGKHVINYDSRVFAELYDIAVNYTTDIDFIKRLIADKGKLNILECFTGTGRILIPLAEDGHRIAGIDLASSMLERAQQKIDKLDDKIKNNITLINDDITKADWGSGYDLIVIGCNAFFELPSPEIQEQCITKAFAALKAGGHIFIDNDDYKGNWSQISTEEERVIFEGIVSDGTFGRVTLKHDSFDDCKNLLDFTHKLYVKTPDGKEDTYVYKRRKHPVTAAEVEQWLEKTGFNILGKFGDWQGNAFDKDCRRGIFWARK